MFRQLAEQQLAQSNAAQVALHDSLLVLQASALNVRQQKRWHKMLPASRPRVYSLNLTDTRTKRTRPRLRLGNRQETSTIVSMLRLCSDMSSDELLRMENAVLRRKVDYLQQHAAQQAHSAKLEQFDSQLDMLREMRTPGKRRM